LSVRHRNIHLKSLEKDKINKSTFINFIKWLKYYQTNTTVS